MKIPIYKSEIEDGISELVKTKASIDFLSQLKVVEPTETYKAVSHKAISQVPQLVNLTKDHWDLYYLNSVLASIGWNDNDDVFDPVEMWLARNSPVYKQVNYMHNEKDIIGNIIASIVLDSDGNIVDDNAEQLPDMYDIIVASVLYKKWEDPALQERMDNLIKGISLGEWFVSMECLFRNFDYAVITPSGEHKVIARNNSTAFLTKYLRYYGGPGQYDGNKIGRLLRSFTFSGKGIVTNPANKRSVILTDSVKNALAQSIIQTKEKSEDIKIMPDNDMITQNLRDELNKSNARAEKLEAKLNELVEEARRNEREKLEKEIAALKVDIDDLNKKVTAQVKEIENRDTSVKELEKKLKEAGDSLAEANKKLEASKLEAVKSSRISKLVSVGVETSEAEKITEKWVSASDEQFEDIVSLHKKEDKSESAKDDKKKTVSKEDDCEDVGNMDDAKADDDVAGAIASEVQSDELIKSVAGVLGRFLGRNKDNEE